MERATSANSENIIIRTLDELFTMFIVLAHSGVRAYLYVSERAREIGRQRQTPGRCARTFSKWYSRCKTRLKARRSLIMHSTIHNNRARWCFISWYDITTCQYVRFPCPDRLKLVELKLTLPFKSPVYASFSLVFREKFLDLLLAKSFAEVGSASPSG